MAYNYIDLEAANTVLAEVIEELRGRRAQVGALKEQNEQLLLRIAYLEQELDYLKGHDLEQELVDEYENRGGDFLEWEITRYGDEVVKFTSAE